MFSLRLATSADLETLVPRVLALNEHEHIILEMTQLRTNLGQLLASPSLGAVFLVMQDERPIGYALTTFSFDLEFGGREAWLTEIWIDEDARGTGAGAARELLQIDRLGHAGLLLLRQLSALALGDQALLAGRVTAARDLILGDDEHVVDDLVAAGLRLLAPTTEDDSQEQEGAHGAMVAHDYSKRRVMTTRGDAVKPIRS